jgi:Kef-type K+ transport system membrane component KefB
VHDDSAFDRPAVLGAIFVAICAGAAVTSSMGLSSVFGAFIVGIAVAGDARLADALERRLQIVVVTLFLPLFFAYTGLRTDAGSIHGWVPWLFCALVIAVAIVGKVGGCAAAAALQRLPSRDAWCVGVLMNTRGLMELVVVNIGLDLGVINRPVFFMLVLMAVVTTYMTTPLVRRVLRDTPFEELVERAPFGRRAEPSPAGSV